MRPTPLERLALGMPASFKALWSAQNTLQLGQGSHFPKLLQVIKKQKFSDFNVFFYTLDETMNEGAEINTYLQIDDEEDNIQPSFYSFGTGEREVQVS